jgi:hypothetical protein
LVVKPATRIKPESRYAANDVRTARRSNNTPPTVGFRFGNRLRNQRLKAPFYALKSATKLPNLIDFACWVEALNQRVEGSSPSTPTTRNIDYQQKTYPPK